MKMLSLKSMVTTPSGLQRHSLSDIPAGSCGVVKGLDGGKGFTSRLAAIGLAPGTHLKVVQNYGHGPVIIDVHSARVALGRREALKIFMDTE